MIRAVFTDADNNRINDIWIDMPEGSSRGDIQYVFALDPEFTDFPTEHEHLAEDGLLKVPYPHEIGESIDFYGVLRLTRLP